MIIAKRRRCQGGSSPGWGTNWYQDGQHAPGRYPGWWEATNRDTGQSRCTDRQTHESRPGPLQPLCAERLGLRDFSALVLCGHTGSDTRLPVAPVDKLEPEHPTFRITSTAPTYYLKEAAKEYAEAEWVIMSAPTPWLSFVADHQPGLHFGLARPGAGAGSDCAGRRA